jgi:large subunit ribosomal protein L22
MPETTARLRYFRTSPYKVREVMHLIVGKDVNDAREILRFCERGPADAVMKVLDSAIANAEHNDNMSEDELYVSRAFADEGPTTKRGRPRARGRYGRIKKRSSHLTVVVARYDDDELDRRRRREAAAGAPARVSRRRRVAASRRRAAAAPEHDHDHGDVAAAEDEAGLETVDAGDEAVVTDVDAKGVDVAEELDEEAGEDTAEAEDDTDGVPAASTGAADEQEASERLSGGTEDADDTEGSDGEDTR